jgi:hypothetical protein
VNDADRLGHDPAMRWIVGGKAIERGGASTSQMGRFETELLSTNVKLATLANLAGVWSHNALSNEPRPKSVSLSRPSDPAEMMRFSDALDAEQAAGSALFAFIDLVKAKSRSMDARMLSRIGARSIASISLASAYDSGPRSVH